jgi:uncharacterized membrane protein YccC
VKPPAFPSPPSRTLTTVAVGFLLLDGVLLGWAGLDLGRPWLVGAAGVCVAAALLVVGVWRRYRRTLQELEDARREMKQDVESLRDLLDRTPR